MAATQVWTIGSLLSWTTDFFAKKGIDEPQLSAELLLAHALECSRMALYTQYERVPPDAQIAAFRLLVKQRAAHVPVAYLVGKGWFFSLEFLISREVLIPRPDTETLVEYVIQHVRQRPDGSSSPGETPGIVADTTLVSGPCILDLCTGSGIIPVALAKNLPAATFAATDISTGALAVARQNAQLHQVAQRITFLEGDLYEPVDRMPAPTLFHVITANPPYIPTAAIAELPPTVGLHEPRLALDGGPDGLAFHRRIVADAREHLLPGGLLILEMQYDQGPSLQGIFTAAGHFQNIRVIRDAAGHPRCVAGLLALPARDP